MILAQEGFRLSFLQATRPILYQLGINPSFSIFSHTQLTILTRFLLKSEHVSTLSQFNLVLSSCFLFQLYQFVHIRSSFCDTRMPHQVANTFCFFSCFLDVAESLVSSDTTTSLLAYGSVVRGGRLSRLQKNSVGNHYSLIARIWRSL